MRDDEAAEHDQQQHERHDQDDRDRVGGTSDEHVGEVVVLARRAADLGGRHRGVEPVAQSLDHLGGGGVVDRGAGRDPHDDPTRSRREG